MSFDWKKTLGTVAPTIATAIGGPLGGVAAKVALEALGIEGTVGELEGAVLSGDPEVMLKLKEAEQQFKLDMEKLKVDVYSLDVKDRNSARQLAISKGMIPQSVLSAIFVVGFVGVLWILFSGEVVVADKMMQPAMYVLGILSAGIIQIMNYWFGSSSGSKDKTAQLQRNNK